MADSLEEGLLDSLAVRVVTGAYKWLKEHGRLEATTPEAVAEMIVSEARAMADEMETDDGMQIQHYHGIDPEPKRQKTMRD